MALEWRWWKLNEATGNAVDSSDNSDNLTEQGTVSSQTGKIDASRGPFSTTNRFDNTSFSGFASTQSFSITFWAYCHQNPDADNYFSFWGDTTNQFQVYTIYDFDPGRWVIQVGKTGVGGDTAVHSTASSSGNWYWFCVTYNGSTGAITANINNGTQGTGTYAQGSANAFDKFYLSHPSSNPAKDFYMEDFRFFDFILSSTQQDFIYNSGSGTDNSLGVPDSSDVLLNAYVKAKPTNENNLNARIYYEKEGSVLLLINGKEFSDNYMKIRTVRKLSQLSQFECELTGIESADKAYIKKGATVYFYFDSNDNLMQKGRIDTIEYQTEFDCKITGYGMAKKLMERKVNPKDIEGRSIFTNTASDTIIKTLCSYSDSTESKSLEWRWWKLNEARGNAIDSSTNANDLSQIGVVPFQTGKIGNARGPYSTSNRFANTSFSGFDSNDSFSITFWAYCNAEPTEDVYLIYFGNVTDELQGYLIYDYSAKLWKFTLGKNGVGSDVVSTSLTPVAGNWYWVCMTYISSTANMNITVNTSTNEGYFTHGETTPFTGFYIGHPTTFSPTGFYFDDLRMYDFTLSESQKAELYNSGTGKSQGLGEYSLNSNNFWIIDIGQNDSIPGLTIRFDEEDKLRAVAATAEQANLDWWMTHVGESKDIINVGLRDTASKMTFTTAGANQNAYSVSYEEDTENLANYVVAIGKGDGVNQYSTTYYDASPTWTEVSGTGLSAYSPDSNTNFLYHFENNGTDSGPSGLDLGVSGAVTYISSGNRLGSYSVGEMDTGSYFVYTGSPYDLWLYNMPSGTFETWVYSIGEAPREQIIYSRESAVANLNLSVFIHTDRKIHVYFRDLSTSLPFQSTNSISLDEWNHVALTWDVSNNEAKIYLNGNLDSVHNGSYYLRDGVPGVRQIGAFSGYFDEMRLSNSIRTAFGAKASFINETRTNIPVSGTTGFSSPGTINIGNEQIIYSGTDATQFTDCTRGANSTTAVTHPMGALTYKYVSSGTFWADHTLSESGSSIYTNNLRFKKLDAKDTEDINAVQTSASNYLKLNKTKGERIIIEVGDMRDVFDNVDVGEWVTVTDADTGLDADYKVMGMETIISYEDGETMYLELVNTKKVLLEELMKSTKNVSILNAYSQGSTTSINIGPQEGNTIGGSTGFDYPLSMRFYIPSDAKKINSLKLSWNQDDFQGTTSGTSSGIYTQSGAYQSVSIKVNGTDRTTALGGPWSGNSVADLDVSSYFTLGGYHTIDLCTATSNARRISANGWGQAYLPAK